MLKKIKGKGNSPLLVGVQTGTDTSVAISQEVSQQATLRFSNTISGYMHKRDEIKTPKDYLTALLFRKAKGRSSLCTQQRRDDKNIMGSTCNGMLSSIERGVFITVAKLVEHGGYYVRQCKPLTERQASCVLTHRSHAL